MPSTSYPTTLSSAGPRPNPSIPSKSTFNWHTSVPLGAVHQYIISLWQLSVVLPRATGPWQWQLRLFEEVAGNYQTDGGCRATWDPWGQQGVLYLPLCEQHWCDVAFPLFVHTCISTNAQTMGSCLCMCLWCIIVCCFTFVHSLSWLYCFTFIHISTNNQTLGSVMFMIPYFHFHSVQNIYAVCDLTLGVLTTKVREMDVVKTDVTVLHSLNLSLHVLLLANKHQDWRFSRKSFASFKTLQTQTQCKNRTASTPLLLLVDVHIVTVVYSLQDAPTNTACYLPPEYNCTPLAKVHIHVCTSILKQKVSWSDCIGIHKHNLVKSQVPKNNTFDSNFPPPIENKGGCHWQHEC